VLGVTLPTEYLNDSDVSKIGKQYETELKRYTLLFAVLPISFFLTSYMSISMTLWMIWLLIFIFMINWPYIKYNRKLTLLKLEKQWTVVNAGKTMIDMKTATGRIRTLRPALFILPILFSAIPLFYEIVYTYGSDRFLTNVIVILSISSITLLSFLFGLFMDRQKSEVISTNSEINVNFNRAKKHIWSNFWLTLSWVNTAFSFALWAFLEDVVKNIYFFLTITIIYTIIILYISIRSGILIQKLRYNITSNLSADSEQVLTDEDANWIWGIMYYNPNDKNTMVDRRLGMGTTLNMATKAGKGVILFTALTILSIPILCIWLLFEEFTPIDLKVNDHQIIAEHLSQVYVIDQKDMKDIQFITQLPKMSKVNGNAMENQRIGLFSVDGYEDCKLCLNPKNSGFIVIKTEKNTYFFSDETDTETKDVYNKLMETYKK
jgi:hypothetical protein